MENKVREYLKKMIEKINNLEIKLWVYLNRFVSYICIFKLNVFWNMCIFYEVNVIM